MVQPVMTQIETIVFLMMENRSLDNVLGWLYDGTSKDYNGLRANTYFQPLKSGNIVSQYPVVPVPDSVDPKYKYVLPYYDPTEAMYSNTSWSGVLNQLFGNENMITGMPVSPAPLTSLGFLQDYYRYGRDGFSGQDILWTYQPALLPIINVLASRYGVSDAWFCSVPTQTNPNRAYSIIGTSQGRENDSWDAVETYNGTTIFNALEDAGKKWGLYFHDVWSDKKSFTEYTFPYMTSKSTKKNYVIGSHPDFFTAAQAGNLPNFTYLEPRWGWGTGVGVHQGTDYHPPTDVRPAEQFLAQVYLALRQSPQWDKMLFIVTFDEHGGTYDHVKPKWGAINPDGKNGDQGFKFDLFGARVPTLLISRYVKDGTVFRAPFGSRFPFDHTSFIKTLLRWAGSDPQTTAFGRRMPEAPAFDHVLSATPVNDLTVDVDVPPFETGETLNAIFEGVGFASIRKILRDSKTVEEAKAEAARYRADPTAFEAELSAESGPKRA